MESIIYDKIVAHCTKNNILNNAQHGFREKHSTISNLLELLNYITLKVDDGNNVDLITIDFAKAFDSISHNKLLHKLKGYGIGGKILAWIKDFLMCRSFNVNLHCVESDVFPVDSSVPQGSKLGPLMYILYANDLAKIFKFAQLKMYADDLSIYAVINSDEDRLTLQYELNELCLWAKKWGLSINYGKCNVLHFGHSNCNFVYFLCDHVLNVTTNEKVLGVMIDSSLSFKEHVYMCVKKGYSVCNLILRNLHHLNRDMLVEMYKTYARPLLEYGSVIFSPHHLYLIDIIERVQRNFTKRLPGLHNVSYCERLQLCKLESLEVRRLHSDLIMTYKIINGLISVNLGDSFVLSSNNRTRGHLLRFVKKHVKLDIRKYFFAYRVANIWNSMNNDVVCSRSLNEFVFKLSSVDLTGFLKGRAFN
jgi:ribonucleases P/MRP protein subunit RPP40